MPTASMPAATPTRTALAPPVAALCALACGVAVANVYFPQASTSRLASGLGVSAAAATAVATVAQLGYAAGIFLVVPLGDRLSRRPLVATLFALMATALLLAGLAPSVSVLYIFSALIGLVTVVPQILIPMAADLSDGRSAGSAVGLLQAGLLGGILLARAFGGSLAAALGWRAPYLVAAGLAAALAIALAVALPAVPRPSAGRRYRELLAATVGLFGQERDLRRSCLYQALLFGAFTAAWTSVALLLTGDPYNYGTGVVGLVALVGAGSVLVVPRAGRLVDRTGPDAINLMAMLGVLAAAALLLSAEAGGAVGLVGLCAALLVLDVAVQSSQVANQARIFALVPGARSRLNSAYMTCVFLGGSAGSWLGAHAFLVLGWSAVCALTAVAALAALARHAIHRRHGATASAPSRGDGTPARR